MRLTKKYLDTFVKVISSYMDDTLPAKLYLYGSRVDDTLRGGDIDLLLIVKTKQQAKQLRENKAEILGHFFLTLEEQKIDLLIMDESHAKVDPFVTHILKKAILIHRWN